MQGSMRTVVLLAVTLLVALAALTYAGTSVAATTSCSDLSYLTSAVKATKKNVAALKLAKRSRWTAALVPANQALWIAKHSAQPCDEGTDDYWLHRQYSIKYDVALVRYLEEMKQGDYDRADIYWSSVEFWGDEITDITYGW